MSEVDEKVSVSSWKARLLEMDASMTRRSVPNKHSEKRYYKEKEVGFIHQDNKSCIRIADDGDINMFASDVAGIKIDKQSESVIAFGNTINAIANEFNVCCSSTGFSWNGYYFNPTFYLELVARNYHANKDIKIYCRYRRWDRDEDKYIVAYKWEPLFIKKPVKTIYNEGINELLRDLNIPL